MRNGATTSKSLLTSFKGRFPLQGVDRLFLALVVAMVLFGLLMVYSASFIYAQERTGNGFYFINKQIVYSLLGFLALFAACKIDYRKWSEWNYAILAFSTVLLVLVMVPGLGARAGGAQRWIKLAGIQFQPGEFAKFALILFVSSQLAKKQERLDTLAAGVLSNLLLPMPLFILLLVQPDFGSVALLFGVLFFLMYIAGVPKKYLLSMFILVSVIGIYLALGTPYRRQRLQSFFNPWLDPSGKGFQILQSFVGFHNGHIFGVGLGNGKEKLFYLPEAHNDFLFAVIGEELGFLGIAGVVFTFIYFIYKGIRIGWDAYKKSGDHFALYLAMGITLMLGLQGFVNMSVALGLLPTKGLTLPFMSYGGSALLMDLFAVGVLLSISRGGYCKKTY